MAAMSVTEFNAITNYRGTYLPWMRAPAVVDQAPVAIAGGVANNSAAFNAQTRFIRVAVDTACHVAIGPAVTATVNSYLMPANTVEIYAVNPGDRISNFG